MFFKLKNPLSKDAAEFLVVGLGNPGTQYEKTRHNAGFLAIDYIADNSNVEIKKSKFSALCAEATIEGKKCILMKPQTYMNLSGEAVSRFATFYKIPFENIIVFSDDISLPVGKIRIRRKGSHGGHNGLKNISSLLNSDNFPRIKIGVGSKPPEWDLANWVLSRFSEDEMKLLKPAIEDTFGALKLMVSGKINDAMSKFN